MVTFDPPLPDEAAAGDSGHTDDHNAIVAALETLNAEKAESTDLTDGLDTVTASIAAINTELGTDPSGSYATVKARFDAIESTTLPQIDAKGDLLVGTADNTYDNLTVGSNDTVLIADSTTFRGVKWAQIPTAGIADSAVTSAKIADGTIVNADINASAAIAATKIAGTALTAESTGIFNVRDYGAVGDDTADDTAEIQAALTAGAGEVVYVPPGVYKITDALTVAAGTTITGPGTIHQTGTGKIGLDIGGNGVTVEGITLKGRHASAAYSSGEHAIDATAANLAGAFTDLTIRNVTITLWGAYGVFFQWVNGFTISGSTITDTGYTGIGVLSGANGVIQGTRVDNITPGSDGNMYGIALSYGGTEGAANPSTRDVVVDANVVTNVDWEGIDAHGGLRLTISNNTISGCLTGIAFTQGDTTAATGCVVTGNVVDTLSDTSDGTAYAMQVFGLVTDDEIDYAATVTITGNHFRRCSALQLEGTRGTIVANNTFQESYQYAIFVLAANEQLAITGNQFIDVWSGTESGYCIIVSSSSNNTDGIVVNNLLARGDKTATWVNYCGIYVNASATGTAWKVGWNDFALASWDAYAGTLTTAGLPTLS